jgi:hypothetical protein
VYAERSGPRTLVRTSPPLARRIAGIRLEIGREFGVVARLAGPVVGAFLLAAMHREAWRLRRHARHEPPTFYETNRPQDGQDRRAPSPCRWVSVGGAEAVAAALAGEA